MIQVQKIACVNHAAIVMSFAAEANGTSSASTGHYPVNQTKVIDLSQSGFAAGAECWPKVSAEAGRTIASDDHVTFAMNGQTATYEVRGTTSKFSVDLVGQPSGSLPNFPAGVPLAQYPYTNWAGDLTLQNVWTCAPRSPQDVVDVCNWAAANSFQVRARGFMHGWSPLTVIEGMSTDSLLLVDLTKSLNQMAVTPAANGQPPTVRVGAGALMVDLLTYLEQQTGGGGTATGYSFPHTPAPGNLTVGGVLAINAHGTAVPLTPYENLPSGYGSMSNHVLELTAVVTDPSSPTPNTYALKTFQRGDPDIPAFLTHLGRAMVVEAVLEIVPNYNLRCLSYTNVPATTLFPVGNPSGPPPTNSFADLVQRYGRVEIIWFPFTDNPWLHLWQMTPTMPVGSQLVVEPYNYPFADHVNPAIQTFLNYFNTHGGLGGLTPKLGQAMFDSTNDGLAGKSYPLGTNAYPVSDDIWGTSRNVLLYIQDTTLKVTANGYAIQLNHTQLQKAVAAFVETYQALIQKYQSMSQYPVNSAVEIRATALDDPSKVGMPPGQQASTPVLSSLTYDIVASDNAWDMALWVDVLTLPGTPNANDFYADLEGWLTQTFTGSTGRVFPEWSKGWAYSSAGPWTNPLFLQYVRSAFTKNRASNQTWSWAASTLQQYDASNLFWNPFLESLFGTT
jgi:hypothetical protein